MLSGLCCVCSGAPFCKLEAKEKAPIGAFFRSGLLGLRPAVACRSTSPLAIAARAAVVIGRSSLTVLAVAAAAIV